MGTLQNKKVLELSEYIPFVQIMSQHAKLFELQNSGVYLKTPWSILFSDDLQLGVDCENDFDLNDRNLSNAEFYNVWQPKALEDILEEIIEDVGSELCSVRTGNTIRTIIFLYLFIINTSLRMTVYFYKSHQTKMLWYSIHCSYFAKNGN